ncbi:hypothetical protein FE257_010111 [Aspergillus nanangensis]|uniref:Uncharacterized protein n=1 Tax=Aspergillus nanangensis TaxID=2582783 RepID=A0AAD4GTK7_ASPNN|nr:hypothetical protein FE257_010111 [Aspergillus nanangensis]
MAMENATSGLYPQQGQHKFQQMLEELPPWIWRGRRNILPGNWNPNRWTLGFGEYDDLPLIEIDDRNYITGNTRVDEPSADCLAFESACRDGPLSTLEAVTSSRPRTPAFLHQGLLIAIRVGNVDAAQYLLEKGAPIVRCTARNILWTPPEKQIPIGEVLLVHGWNPNTPDIVDCYLLPEVITNLPFLRWLLTHAGADPNIGKIGPEKYDFEGRETNGSCESLEKAACDGHLEAMHLLLDAGANINNGFPLHAAAGSDIYYENGHRRGRPSEPSPSPEVRKEFEERQIAIMSLLIERGVDINQEQRVVMGNMVPAYPVLEAIWAQSIQRAQWLIEQGANLEVTGGYGPAMEIAELTRNPEMTKVVEEGIRARRWVKKDAEKAIGE